MGLAAAIRQLRLEGGLSRKELAAKAGLSSSCLSRIESGHYDPRWGDMRRMAQGLGISLRALGERAEACEAELALRSIDHLT